MCRDKKRMEEESGFDFYLSLECEGEKINHFRCTAPTGEHYMTYLKEYAVQEKQGAVLHYIMNKNNDELVAYFSFLAFAILLSEADDSLEKNYRAIELKRFAVDDNYRNQFDTNGEKASDKCLKWIKEVAEEYSGVYIGAQALVAYPPYAQKVVGMYVRNGFTEIPAHLTTITTHESPIGSRGSPVIYILNEKCAD